MAINQTSVALDSCTKIVTAVTQLLDALDDLEAIAEQLAGAAIDLETFEAEIEAGDGISHCDAATYKTIVSAFAPAIVTALKADYDGSPTMQGWASFQKARH
jgi:hypothetical protein